MTTEIERLKSELKESYRERLKVNLQIRELKKKAKKTIPYIKVNETQKPRGPDTALSVVQVAVLMGCSRDRVYDLLREKRLGDLHPYTVGQFMRPGGTIGREPKGHTKSYKEWKCKWNKYDEQVSAKKEKEANEVVLKDARKKP